MADLDLKDIQGFIVRGYGNLEAACYLLVGVHDPAAARRWLGTLTDRITNGATKPDRIALNVALTHEGLAALGLDREARATFSREFQEGMASERAQVILGDHGENAPEKWAWGGPKTPVVHLLLLLFAVDEPTLDTLCESLSGEFPSGGVAQIGETLRAVVLRDAQTGCGKEHFGFCDAIAQPLVEGLGRTGPTGNTVKAGEFILGYPNEYKLLTESPRVQAERDSQKLLPDDPTDARFRDLGRNGTYLVFRQLHQDVGGFWRFLESVTRGTDGDCDLPACIRLAAKMVGRWPSGAPLVETPDRDDPALGTDDDFGYHTPDPHGLRCPLGAHIRRTNPRDSLSPHPGTERSLAINRMHRILRRGRAYGQPVADSMQIADIVRGDASGERGIHFICLNANISRQFEFVQQSWMNSPKFAGLYSDADPLTGDRDPGGKGEAAKFTVPAIPVRKRITGLPQFVFVRGGAYFFLPGLCALRYLARLDP